MHPQGSAKATTKRKSAWKRPRPAPVTVTYADGRTTTLPQEVFPPKKPSGRAPTSRQHAYRAVLLKQTNLRLPKPLTRRQMAAQLEALLEHLQEAPRQ